LNWRRLITLIAGLAIAVGGCAAQSSLPAGRTAIDQYREISTRHASELRTYAALLRVKLKRDRRIDDFRVEIFSRRRDELSLYVRGFLGSAVFKAVVRGNELECYFPREKRHFRGLVDDLESGELSESRHIIDLLLSFYRGSYEISPDELWTNQVKKSGKNFQVRMVDSLHAFRFDSNLQAQKKFPSLRAENIKLESRDRSFVANIEIQNSSFNREIPDEKFALEIPESSVVLTREDLANLLTGLSQ